MHVFSFKGRPHFARASALREANRESQKFCPFVKMAEDMEVYPHALKLTGINCFKTGVDRMYLFSNLR